MIRGVGLDMCQIQRMTKLLADGRFLTRYFDEGEQTYIKGRNAGAAQSAAGIFAAKEAALKALGTGLGGAPLKDIVIAHRQGGQPYYILKGKAASLLNKLGGGTLYLSITHEGDTAAAVAIWEDPGGMGE